MLPIVHHPDYVAPIPADHRFPMNKFRALIEHLRAIRLVDGANELKPAHAMPRWLELAHTQDYVAGVLNQTLSADEVRRLGLPMTEAVARRAQAAVGGTVLAARLALEHGLACNTAGGSHHAHPGFGAGFCVFNDVAVAARVLLAEGQVGRILVVDLDVHQGDGTAVIFAGDPRVFTFSMHCGANYPHDKARSDLDLEVPAGTGDAGYLERLRATLPGLLDTAGPDLVFYNAGVDPHRDDKLGKLALSDDGLRARDAYVLDTIRGRGLPVACVIGGGYGPNVETLGARHATVHRAAAERAGREAA